MGNLVAFDSNNNPINLEELKTTSSFSYTVDDSLNINKDEGISLSVPMKSTSYYALLWTAFEKLAKDILTPKIISHNRKTAETIVIWKDGTKTVVKPMEGTPEAEMSSYTAFTAALAKKLYGSNTQVNKIVAKTFEPVKRKERLKDVIESMGDEG